MGNDGNNSARSFNVAVYLPDDGTTQGALIRTYSIRGLTAGELQNLRFGYFSRTSLSGKYVMAVIDSTDQVTETDENNNRMVEKVP